ncbi:MAG TPA: dihydroorotate dehydrogenase electron transfer subunit [Armatimonadota bacterium]
MMRSRRATVVHRQQVTPLHTQLRLRAPEIANLAAAGQFVHLRVTSGADPLLRRPFSVMLCDPVEGFVDLLVQNVGRGSEIVALAGVGQSFDLLGPLGTPFPLPPPHAHAVLVAGGVGVAPMIALADRLSRTADDHHITSLFGARTEELLCCWQELAGRSHEFLAVTEDGSLGEPGLVTGPLAGILDVPDPETRVVYACGPEPMLAAVARMCAERAVECYVSLERWMGCGVGACLGCVVPAAHPAGDTSDATYLRVCKDGPVFAAGDIDWGASCL